MKFKSMHLEMCYYIESCKLLSIIKFHKNISISPLRVNITKNIQIKVDARLVLDLLTVKIHLEIFILVGYKGFVQNFLPIIGKILLYGF